MSEATATVSKVPRVFKRGVKLYARVDGGARILGALFKALNEFSSDVPLALDWDFVSMRFMDASRVMMADVKILKSFFDEWSVSEFDSRTKIADLPVNVGYVNVGDILYALEGAGKDSRVVVEMPAMFEAKRVKRRVTIRVPDVCPKCGRATISNQLPTDKRGKYNDRYKCICGWRGRVRLREKTMKFYESALVEHKTRLVISVDRERYEMPIHGDRYDDIPDVNLRFDAKVVLSLNDIRSRLSKLSKKFDTARFVASSEEFSITTSDGDVKSGNIVYRRGDDELIELEAHKVQEAIYSIKNLLCVLPPIGDLATLEFSKDMPLKTSIRTGYPILADFYLAPRITSG